MGTELAARPICPSSPEHGRMEYCPPATYEQRWVGVTYACPRCHSSSLDPSKELLAYLASVTPQKG